MSTEHDYYLLLGLEDGASIEHIHAQYRHLVKVYHPDRNPGDKEWCEEQLRRINEAYHHLSDPHRKATYDQRRGSAQTAPATSPHFAAARSYPAEYRETAPDSTSAADEYEEDAADASARTHSAWRRWGFAFAQRAKHQPAFRAAGFGLLALAILSLAGGYQHLAHAQTRSDRAADTLNIQNHTSAALTSLSASSSQQDSTQSHAEGLDEDKAKRVLQRIKAPLFARYNAVAPQVEATISQAQKLADAAQNTEGTNDITRVQKGQDLQYAIAQLEQAQVVAKGDIDDLDTWTPKNQLQDRIFNLDKDFQNLGDANTAVQQDMQALQTR